MTALPFSKDAFQAKVSEHFETALATIGIGFAIVYMTGALIRGDDNLTLLFVVWYEGVILWAVRHHIRVGREHLVRKLRLMLQDRVNNQLTVLVGLTDFNAHAPSTAAKDDTEIALTAARAVSHEIETLSMESLHTWETRYSRHLPSPMR